MKKFSAVVFGLVFVALFAIAASAQVPAVQKIGWIDTGAFGDEKEGVTKYVNSLKALATEMKPRVTKLQGMQTRLKAISDELAKMNTANPAVPVDAKAAQAKQDEGEKLQRDFD